MIPPAEVTEKWSAEQVLEWGLRRFFGRISLASSFQAEESVIIDGCAEAGRVLREAAGTSVRYVLQTNGHSDHVQALPELKAKLGVPVGVHPADAEMLPVAVDFFLNDGDTLSFGRQSLKVLHTPGHTPGGVCFLLGRHLFSGDTLFPGGPGNTWGDKVRFAQIIEAIRSKLFVLPDDTVVYPGHGADTTIGRERPHLDEWIARGW